MTIGVGALIDLLVTYFRQHELVWPASGILTGSGVAFVLRASGTDNGDWWSLNGIRFFVLAVVLAMASKHLIRPGGRHRFNPSSVGLVWTLLVIGPTHVFPQYLWWGPNDLAVTAAYGVILVGGLWILPNVRMEPMIAAAVVVTLAAPVNTAVLAGNEQVILIESGLAGKANAQWLLRAGLALPRTRQG